LGPESRAQESSITISKISTPSFNSARAASSLWVGVTIFTGSKRAIALATSA
jgi:hypothetical protein